MGEATILYFKIEFVWLGFLGGACAEESACQCRRCKRCRVPSLGWEDSLEKEMATHSSILAWKTLRTEEPDGLQSMGLKSLTQLSMQLLALSGQRGRKG